jgi:hypothetical protein
MGVDWGGEGRYSSGRYRIWSLTPSRSADWPFAVRLAFVSRSLLTFFPTTTDWITKSW